MLNPLQPFFALARRFPVLALLALLASVGSGQAQITVTTNPPPVFWPVIEAGSSSYTTIINPIGLYEGDTPDNTLILQPIGYQNPNVPGDAFAGLPVFRISTNDVALPPPPAGHVIPLPVIPHPVIAPPVAPPFVILPPHSFMANRYDTQFLQVHSFESYSRLSHFSIRLARAPAQSVSVSLSVAPSGRAVAILYGAPRSRFGMTISVFLGSVSSQGILTARATRGGASITGRVTNGQAHGVIVSPTFTSSFSGVVNR